MAKDRAKDPKRVPNLGISNPISHVSVMDPSHVDSSYGVTPANRQSQVKAYNDTQTRWAEKTHSGEFAKRAADMTTVSKGDTVKINSNPVKGK